MKLFFISILQKRIKRPMTTEHKKAISLSSKGKIRCSRRIVNIETKQEFESIKKCLSFYNISYGIFYRIIKNGGGRIPLKYK